MLRKLNGELNSWTLTVRPGDFDGDGFSNYDEVYAGYLEDGNVYKYDIYNSSSKPSSNPGSQSAAVSSPTVTRPSATTMEVMAKAMEMA